MYSIPKNVLDALRSDAQQSVRIKVSPLVGAEFILTGEDIRDRLEIERAALTGDKLELGSAVMSKLSFSIENYSGKFNSVNFEGAKLFVNIDIELEDGSNYPIPMGYYQILSPPRTLDKIKVAAYDRMSRFDISYNTELSFPATVYQIVIDCCKKCNVPCALTADWVNANMEVPAKPNDSSITFRQVLIWCAQLMGICFYIDRDGRLDGKWYEKTCSSIHPSIESTDRFMGSTNFAEKEITVTGVKIETGDRKEFLAGAGEYAFNIKGNALIQEGMDASAIAKKLYDRRTFSYKPMKCSTHSFPHLEPLDRIKFIKNGENPFEFETVLTNVTYVLNGNSILESKGKTAQEEKNSIPQAFTSAQLSMLEQRKSDTQKELESAQQLLLEINETMLNSFGYYMTQVKDKNGGVVTYTHNRPKLEESQTIYCRKADGFVWTDEGWNNGKPKWKYGIDKNGNAILKTIAVNKLYAQYIESGILSSKTGKFTINLDTGKCIFSDMQAAGTFTALGKTYDLKVSNQTLYPGESYEKNVLGLFKYDKKGKVKASIYFSDWADWDDDSIIIENETSNMGLNNEKGWISRYFEVPFDGSPTSASYGLLTGNKEENVETALKHVYGQYHRQPSGETSSIFLDNNILTISRGSVGEHPTLKLKVEDKTVANMGGLANEVSAAMELYTVDGNYIDPVTGTNADSISLKLKSCGVTISTITFKRDGRIYINGKKVYDENA